MIRIYSFLLIISTLCLFGCFTVPGDDRIITVNSFVNEDLGCIRPLCNPIDRVEYISANQSLKSKINYINRCMINYSWGRGWSDEQDVKN
jgi:hypothetical protein